MQDVFARVSRELLDIPLGVLRGIRDELLFPKKRLSPWDELLRKQRSQYMLVRSQQDQLQVQAGMINKANFEKAQKDTLLEQRTRECVALKKRVASLEFALREATQRNKRRR